MERGKVQFKTVFLEKVLPKDKRINLLIDWGKKFGTLGIAPETKGNLSFRTKKGFVITGTGKALRELGAKDLVEVREVKKEGKSFVIYCQGEIIPSMESIFHQEIYKLRPEINAIFHLHDREVMEKESKLEIPSTEIEQPAGSYLLVKEIKKLIEKNKGVNYFILKNHGIVALGKNLTEVGELIKSFHKKAKSNLKVLGCGTMMVDIFLRDLENIAEPETVVYPEKPIDIYLGGHAIDFGIDLAKLGMNPLEIGVIGAKGEGIIGEYLAQEIKKYGLQTFFQEIKGIDNGKNVIINRKGEGRRLHMHPGANWYLDPEWVKKIVRENSFNIFSIRPGYSGVDLHLRGIFEEIKKKGAFILLDIMKPHPERPPLFVLPDIELVDAIHCNEKEAMVNTGKEDPEEALKTLLDKGAKVIFLTKGEKGAEIITKEFRISQPSFQKIEAIDATGCGDAFCAGVYYKMIEFNQFEDIRKLSSEQLKELLAFSQAVGASAATKPGCVEGVSKEMVEQILKNESEEIIKKTKVEK